MTMQKNRPSNRPDQRYGAHRDGVEAADACPDDCHYCSGPETD